MKISAGNEADLCLTNFSAARLCRKRSSAAPEGWLADIFRARISRNSGSSCPKACTRSRRRHGCPGRRFANAQPVVGCGCRADGRALCPAGRRARPRLARLHLAPLWAANRSSCCMAAATPRSRPSCRDLLDEEVEVLCVKGSGWDMAAIEPAGPARRAARAAAQAARRERLCPTRRWCACSAPT